LWSPRYEARVPGLLGGGGGRGGGFFPPQKTKTKTLEKAKMGKGGGEGGDGLTVVRI